MKKQVNKEHYDFLKYIDEHRWDSYYHQIEEAIKCVGDDILYVGVGDGIVVDVINKMSNKKVTTFDFADDLRPDINGSVTEIDKVLNGKKFSVVECCQILEHIPFEEFEKTIEKISKIATEKVILSLPNRGIIWQTNIKIPKIPRIKFSKTTRNIFKNKWDFMVDGKGEHYWEINVSKKHSLKNIKKILRKYFDIEKVYSPATIHTIYSLFARSRIDRGIIKNMKIAVFGTGYVGLSLATLLATKNEVVAVDIVPEKVEMVNNRKSPIQDEYIEKFFAEKELDLLATLDYKEALNEADFVIISTPTNYDSEQNFFNTLSVEDVLMKVSKTNPTAKVVIKSTIPVGFVTEMRKRFPELFIMFSPEFLREGKALYDNLHPSRIIVGDKSENGQQFAKLLIDAAEEEDTPVLLMDSTEAEAVKLFANTFLALRVAYFNELDTYASSKGLNAYDIISGVCLDPRIGDYYNNPSFGYGGYCLPKDTKQLLANYKHVPQNLIDAIVKANQTRKDFIASEVLVRLGDRNVVGVYKLAMKAGSDNFRTSAIIDIINRLVESGKTVVVYDQSLKTSDFNGCRVIDDLEEFIRKSDIILANRMDEKIAVAGDKVYTRDLFARD